MLKTVTPNYSIVIVSAGHTPYSHTLQCLAGKNDVMGFPAHRLVR